MKKILAICFVLTVILVWACNNRRGKNYNKTSADENAVSFMKEAAESGHAEIVLSELALKKSKDTSILNLAKMIIHDHKNANKQLIKIASEENVIIKDTLSAAHKQLMNDLLGKNGNDFNLAYSQAMVNDHEVAIKLFKNAASSTAANIQDFAQQVLPRLQQHFNEANSICIELK
ncbi:DUF4142 domain-containing protein [Mucilaginibacter litoreus]|uniref:DUF4142 domain-containing protein n=1 Tax=Mucilaginibacter litoreus TaxID=1048221 RepID=A0ABW3ARQ1_9SPHI